MSLQVRIKDYLSKNPTSQMKDLLRNFPGENYSYLAKTKSVWKKETQGKTKKSKKKSLPSKKKKIDTTSHLSPVSSADSSQDVSLNCFPGTPLKLTEEVFETALVHALQTDPTKALNAALAFLDKKKALSIDESETSFSRISLKKLQDRREELFS